MNKWDLRFLDMARLVASWSKDPSTKCGAVIVRPNRTIASVGFNGFARGCDDYPEMYADRELKYARVVHSEINAIVSASEPLSGYTMYVYTGPRKLFTCARCAGPIIQSGIDRVVVHGPIDDEHWKSDHDLSIRMYAEADVKYEVIKEPLP